MSNGCKEAAVVYGLIFSLNFLFVVTMIALSWPLWWNNINLEHSPLTWFSSTQLVLVSCMALLIAVQLRRHARGQKKRDAVLWVMYSLAFAVLALDERFSLHEKIRDRWLNPNGLAQEIPGIGPGEIVLLSVAVVGIAFFWFTKRIFEPRARYFFYVAIGVTLVALIIDAQGFEDQSLPTVRAMQFTEEILETIGEMFFLMAFTNNYLVVTDA